MTSPFIRKKLTPFLAHEMIYDFVNGTLEPERRAALEEFLASDQESQALVRKIEAAQSYTKTLNGLQVDPEILSQLIEAESAISLGKKYSSWREWPETLRWSVTAIVLSGVVAGAVAIIPWSKLSPRKPVGPEAVEVAQIPHPKLEDAESLAANDDHGSGDEPPDDEGSGDDIVDSSGDAGDEGEALSSAPPVPPPKSVAQVAKPADPSSSKLPELLGRSTPSMVVAVNLPKPSATPVTSGEIADAPVNRDSKARGFVYRAFMNLDDLEEIGPKIRDEIIALGGEKAGEVELGWKRGSGRYYHFTLPESNEKKVLERLQVYGPVRISKDPHPRVMPQGQVRFILWVDSATN